MSSFTFGFWTGFVAGVVFAALAQQNCDENTLEGKFFSPSPPGIETSEEAASSQQTPASLAEALAQTSQT